MQFQHDLGNAVAFGYNLHIRQYYVISTFQMRRKMSLNIPWQQWLSQVDLLWLNGDFVSLHPNINHLLLPSS